MLFGKPNIPPQGIGADVLEESQLQALFPPIADPTYSFYKFYQINKNMVPSIQSNIPLVIIDTIPGNVFTSVTRLDIKVFDSAGNPLEFEHVTDVIDVTQPSNIAIWINMTTITDLEFIQIVYGKSGASDGKDANAVWSGKYKYVSHMNTPESTSVTFDKVLPMIVGVKTNGVKTSPGKIGNALDFDGDDDYVDLGSISFGDKLMLNAQDISVSFIIKPRLTGDIFQRIVAKSNGTAGVGGYDIGIDSNQIIMWIGGSRNIESNPVVTDPNKFYHVVITKSNGIADGRIIINGVDESQAMLSNDIISDTETGMRLGAWNTDLTRNYNGLLEELTISNIIPSFDRAITEFNNKMNNDNFWHKTPLLTNGEPKVLVNEINKGLEVLGN